MRKNLALRESPENGMDERICNQVYLNIPVMQPSIYQCPIHSFFGCIPWSRDCCKLMRVYTIMHVWKKAATWTRETREGWPTALVAIASPVQNMFFLTVHNISFPILYPPWDFHRRNLKKKLYFPPPWAVL
jgi:hypothetical protein